MGRLLSQKGVMLASWAKDLDTKKGKLVGQKIPLRISELWAIRVRPEIYVRPRELALFNLAIDSKLRGCDLVPLRAQDVCHGSHVANRATVMQQKTKQPVQFELHRWHSQKPG
jgi:hypothetical protein